MLNLLSDQSALESGVNVRASQYNCTVSQYHFCCLKKVSVKTSKDAIMGFKDLEIRYYIYQKSIHEIDILEVTDNSLLSVK